MGLAAKVAAEPKRQDQRQVHERISNELGKSQPGLVACEHANIWERSTTAGQDSQVC